jgi:hypothetical protein
MAATFCASSWYRQFALKVTSGIWQSRVTFTENVTYFMGGLTDAYVHYRGTLKG